MIREPLYEITLAEIKLRQLAPKRYEGLRHLLLAADSGYLSSDPYDKERWARSEEGEHYLACLEAAIKDCGLPPDTDSLPAFTPTPRARLSGLALRLAA